MFYFLRQVSFPSLNFWLELEDSLYKDYLEKNKLGFNFILCFCHVCDCSQIKFRPHHLKQPQALIYLRNRD